MAWTIEKKTSIANKEQLAEERLKEKQRVKFNEYLKEYRKQNSDEYEDTQKRYLATEKGRVTHNIANLRNAFRKITVDHQIEGEWREQDKDSLLDIAKSILKATGNGKQALDREKLKQLSDGQRPDKTKSPEYRAMFSQALQYVPTEEYRQNKLDRLLNRETYLNDLQEIINKAESIGNS